MAKKFNCDNAFGGSIDLIKDTWMANGFNEPTQSKVDFKDLISTPNAAVWMPQVVEDIIREPVEPMLIIASLLDTIQHTGASKITLPTLGSLVASDIAEGMSYPEQTLNIAPGSITINIGKSGVAFKITEEMQRYSQYDLINMHLRAGRSALDRHKEKKGMDYISGLGVTLFDNINPLSSVFGTCTGRSITGAGNGSCRMEDLLKAYSHIMMQGFQPNTILIHPLAWSMWLADPLLQTIVKNTGNGQYFSPHNMAKSGNPWAASGQAKQGLPSSYGSFTPSGNAASETATSVKEIDQNLNSPAVIPSYFPYPLRVLVSPFVPYNVNNNTCDIIITDSANLGAIVVDEGVTMKEWEDMSADIIKVKLRERYAYTIYEDGLATGVMRNVPIKANEIALPVQATISSAGSIDELNVLSGISGL